MKLPRWLMTEEQKRDQHELAVLRELQHIRITLMAIEQDVASAADAAALSAEAVQAAVSKLAADSADQHQKLTDALAKLAAVVPANVDLAALSQSVAKLGDLNTKLQAIANAATEADAATAVEAVTGAGDVSGQPQTGG